MGRRRVLTDGQAAEVARRYEAGETIDELAEAFGCSITPIRQALHEAGAKIRPRSWRPFTVDVDDLVRRYQAGETTMQLARAFDVSHNAVRRKLIAAGVALRPRGTRARPR